MTIGDFPGVAPGCPKLNGAVTQLRYCQITLGETKSRLRRSVLPPDYVGETKFRLRRSVLPPDYVGGNEISFTQICV